MNKTFAQRAARTTKSLLKSFGVSATYTAEPGVSSPQAITVIFEDRSAAIEAEDGTIIQSTIPMTQARADDIAGITQSSTLIIDGITYFVTEIIKDDSDLRQLLLRT